MGAVRRGAHANQADTGQRRTPCADGVRDNADSRWEKALTNGPKVPAELGRTGVVALATACSWATRVKAGRPKRRGKQPMGWGGARPRKTAGLRSETGRPEKERRKRAFGPKAREGEDRKENSFSFSLPISKANFQINFEFFFLNFGFKPRNTKILCSSMNA